MPKNDVNYDVLTSKIFCKSPETEVILSRLLKAVLTAEAKSVSEPLKTTKL